MAQDGVMPAQQGLCTHQGPIWPQANLGLVHQPQGAIANGAAQRRFHHCTLNQPFVELGPVKLDVVRALLLGAVHGNAGVAEQRGCVVTIIRKQCNAHAARDKELMAIHHHAVGELVFQTAGDLVGTLWRAFAQRDGKFIAPLPRQGVYIAQGGTQPGRCRFEQAVSYVVAQGVVDFLEVIQVQEQHGQSALAAPRLRQTLGKPV